MHNNFFNKTNNLSLNALNFFFILLPFSILFGPFLADFSISFSCILFLIYLLSNNKIHYLLNRYFFIFLFFCFYLIFISIISEKPYSSLESSLLYFRFGLFVIAIKFIIEINFNILKYFTISLIGAFVTALIYGFIYYIGDFNKILFNATYSRIPLPFTDEFILGSYLARLFPIFFCLYLFFFNYKKKYIFFLSIITILTDVLIYLSGERTAFALISLSIILLIISSKKYLKIRIFTLFFSILIIFFVTIQSTTVKDRMITQTITGIYNQNDNSLNVNNKVLENKNPIVNIDPISGSDSLKNHNLKALDNSTHIKKKFNFFSDTHTSLANSALQIYFDNNIITGIGPKLFRFYCKKEKYLSAYGINSCSTHPHHTYIQLLVETGIIGILAILIIFIYACYIIAINSYKVLFNKHSSLHPIHIGSYIAIIVTLCPIVPSGSFFNNWLSSIYFLPLIFLITKLDKTND